MKTIAAVLLLLFSHSAVAGDAGTDQGIDGGTSGASGGNITATTPDAPLAEVVPVDGGWFLTDARMVLVGQTITNAQNDLAKCKATQVVQPESPSVAKAGLIGAAAGFVIGLAVSIYFYVEVVKP